MRFEDIKYHTERYVLGINWGINWGMSAASSGHVWGITWGMSGASSGAFVLAKIRLLKDGFPNKLPIIQKPLKNSNHSS